MKQHPVKNFSSLWPIFLPKMAKTDLKIFKKIALLDTLTYKMTSKLKLTSPARHNLAVPDLFYFMIFSCDHSVCLKFDF